MNDLTICRGCGETPLGIVHEPDELGMAFPDIPSGFDQKTVICWWCRHYEMSHSRDGFEFVGPGRFRGESGSTYTRRGREPTPQELAAHERAQARNLVKQNRVGKEPVKFTRANLEYMASLAEPEALLTEILAAQRAADRSATVWLGPESAGALEALVRAWTVTAEEHELAARGTRASGKAIATVKACSALAARLAHARRESSGSAAGIEGEEPEG